jgi:hypothetical protein
MEVAAWAASSPLTPSRSGAALGGLGRAGCRQPRRGGGAAVCVSGELEPEVATMLLLSASALRLARMRAATRGGGRVLVLGVTPGPRRARSRGSACTTTRLQRPKTAFPASRPSLPESPRPAPPPGARAVGPRARPRWPGGGATTLRLPPSGWQRRRRGRRDPAAGLPPRLACVAGNAALTPTRAAGRRFRRLAASRQPAASCQRPTRAAG